MELQSRNDKPHILLVIRHPVGGIRTYLKYVYTLPYFSDYRFTVVMPNNEMSGKFVDPIANPRMEYRICKGSISSILIQIIKVLRQEKVDLIHAHGFTSGICSVLPAKVYSIPHVMTAHDVLLMKQFAGLKGKLKRYVVARIFNLIDFIHAVSYDVSRNINETLPELNKDKVITIINGIAVHQYALLHRINFTNECGIDQSYYKIGFLGRFMSQKGFRYLIDAVELLMKEYETIKEFVVISLGAGGFIREETESLISRGLQGKFVFLPPVEDVAPYIKGMDVIVMPSLWEASGLVAMETLVSGVPLIASNCIGLREVIAGSPAFVVEPGNARSLAEAIMESMRDNRLDDFKKYQPVARERFDAANTSRELKLLYEKLL